MPTLTSPNVATRPIRGKSAPKSCRVLSGLQLFFGELFHFQVIDRHRGHVLNRERLARPVDRKLDGSGRLNRVCVGTLQGLKL